MTRKEILHNAIICIRVQVAEINRRKAKGENPPGRTPSLLIIPQIRGKVYINFSGIFRRKRGKEQKDSCTFGFDLL